MHTPDPILSDDGRFWIDPLDGRTVPVVRGGSDNGPAEGASPAGEAGGGEAGGGEPTGAPPAAALESEAGAKAHGFASVDDAVAELQRVRQEAANRRVALKPYEDAFTGFDEEARSTYLQLAKQIASGDPAEQKAAAKRFREIAERIDSSGVPTTPTGDEDPDQKPLTVKEWKALQAEQEEQQLLQSQVKAIEADAEREGIKVGSPTYASYLYALQQPEVAGDHDKAMELVKAERQAIIDDYARSVAEGSAKWPVLPGDGAGGAGAGVEEPVTPKSWKEARKIAAARLAGKAGVVTG